MSTCGVAMRVRARMGTVQRATRSAARRDDIDLLSTLDAFPPTHVHALRPSSHPMHARTQSQTRSRRASFEGWQAGAAAYPRAGRVLPPSCPATITSVPRTLEATRTRSTETRIAGHLSAYPRALARRSLIAQRAMYPHAVSSRAAGRENLGDVSQRAREAHCPAVLVPRLCSPLYQYPATGKACFASRPSRTRGIWRRRPTPAEPLHVRTYAFAACTLAA